MAVHDFVIELMEELLTDKDLRLTEQDIRFYDKGTTAEADKTLDSHIEGGKTASDISTRIPTLSSAAS